MRVLKKQREHPVILKQGDKQTDFFVVNVAGRQLLAELKPDGPLSMG